MSVEEGVAVNAEGSARLTVVVSVQPLTSVTVTVYAPPARLFAIESVPPEGDQLNVKFGVPPLAETCAVPFAAPLQSKSA